MGPILEKFDFSFFPLSVTNFFYAALQKIKSNRQTSKQIVCLSLSACYQMYKYLH